MAVTDKIQMQYALSEDYDLTDLQRQTTGASPRPPVEFSPLSYLPSFQVEIPAVILDDMNRKEIEGDPVTAMSKRHPIAYFGVGRRLYVWDYKRVQQVQR